MLPNVSSAVKAYLQNMTIYKVVKEVVDYENKETLVEIKSKATMQPVDPQHLKILDEGQRSWKFKDLHCLSNVNLKPDDIIIIKGTRYRVMDKWDCSEYGYIEYMIAEGFEE